MVSVFSRHPYMCTVLIASLSLATVSARAQSVTASYPKQHAIILIEGDEVTKQMDKNIGKLRGEVAELDNTAKETTKWEKWQSEFIEYLENAQALAETMRIGNQLYMQGAVLVRNIFLLKKAIAQAPEGIVASLPMNNLYMETVATAIKCNRTLKVILNGGTAGTATPTRPVIAGPNDIVVSVTMTNKTSKDVKFDGKLCFVTYGTNAAGDYTGYMRFKGICNGGDYTIPAGGSKTYSVVFQDCKDETVNGLPFADSSQRGKYQSNNVYYVGGAGYTCEDFGGGTTFRNGGSYSMTIPRGTHEWTSAGGGHLLTGAERTELFWMLITDMKELNRKVRRTAVSIAYYRVIDVWYKATDGMYQKDHRELAHQAFDRWTRAYQAARIFE